MIIYHKNILKIYKYRWINKCLYSIENQTFKDFTVFELSYGNEPQTWWPWSIYSHQPKINHVAAMNEILDKAFETCDIVMNINLDDSYHPDRFKLQIEAIKEGYDLVSSDFQHIEEINGEDVFVRNMIFNDRNIKDEQDQNHNILCHSVVAMTKKFWEENKYYNVNSLGFEDLELWRKAVANNCKIKIIPQILCYYRLSENQTGRIHKHIK